LETGFGSSGAESRKPASARTVALNIQGLKTMLSFDINNNR